MDLGLVGEAAVVPGASKGIGPAVVRALLSEGVAVTAGAALVKTL
jgi:NADP-dependent 3-hydroxy acid dehydrogenase YdfG